MSIDLSYPLALTMGHHDPLDGYLAYSELQPTAENIWSDQYATQRDLHAEIADLAGICAGKSWVTGDPLGLGGLLADAYRAAQLLAGDTLIQPDLPATPGSPKTLKKRWMTYSAPTGLVFLDICYNYWDLVSR